MSIARSQMNRQLYANGTGIARLLKMQQGAAQDQLTEEQAFAMMPEGVKEAYNSMLQAGASPEEARRLISEQIAEMSRQSAMMSEQQMQGESQNIPEYYDSRLQILNPEQMREEMQNPSMPGYAYGGLIGRQQYGLGSLVKSVTKGVTGVVKGAVGAVKDIASSDLGKAALAAAAMYYGGGGNLFGLQRAGMSGFSFGNLPGAGFLQGAKTGIGNLLLGTPGDMGGRIAGTSLFSKIGGALGSIGKGTLLAGGLGLAAGSMLSPQQIQEGMKRNPEGVRRYLAQYYKNTNPEATESEAEQYANEQTREYAAEGGMMGRQNYGIGGMITKLINENPQILQPMTRLVNQPQAIEPLTNMQQMVAQYYGNINPGKSVEEIEEYVRENAAYGGPMGELRTNQEGVKEIDYRQTGGFVPPIGIKEKADDVPAMLSNNEFVFTADAVRNAGGGDVNKGAQKMYSLMKTLENGGMA